MKELIIFIEDQDRLLELSKSQNHEIRAKVAYNKNVSESILETLANDKSELVRGIVSQQLKTPLNVLETLLNDVSPFVRREVNKTLQRKEELEKDRKLLIRLWGKEVDWQGNTKERKILKRYIPLAVEMVKEKWSYNMNELNDNEKIRINAIDSYLKKINDWISPYCYDFSELNDIN